MLFPNKKLLYLLKNRDRNDWVKDIGFRKDPKYASMKHLFHR